MDADSIIKQLNILSQDFEMRIGALRDLLKAPEQKPARQWQDWDITQDRGERCLIFVRLPASRPDSMGDEYRWVCLTRSPCIRTDADRDGEHPIYLGNLREILSKGPILLGMTVELARELEGKDFFKNSGLIEQLRQRLIGYDDLPL